MTNLDSILKIYDKPRQCIKKQSITVQTEVHIVKDIVFPVAMCGCESWTTKKARRRRIDIFKLWCWRRLLRVPWTGKRSNQSILKEINPEYSLEGLMQKLHYFGHLMQRADSLEKTLMLGKVEGRKRRGQHYELNGHDFEQTLGDGEGQRRLVCYSPWGCKELEMT